MSIGIGASGAIFKDRLTFECHVAETRQYPKRVSDCWGVAQKAISNKIYLIFNIDISDHGSVNYDPIEAEWKIRVEEVVQGLYNIGGNKNNCRLTIINEPMKYITKEKYVWYINKAFEQVGSRLLVGAGNEEFLKAADPEYGTGNMYEYILNHANFDILDIHIQGSCLKESACSKWTNWIKNLAVSHNKPLDCTEANYSNVARSDGYNTLLMQLKHAEKIKCKHFAVVFIGLSNESKYKWLSFIYNGVDRTFYNETQSYWQDLKRIMKEKAPIDEIPPIIKEGGTMKRGDNNNKVLWLQDILRCDFTFYQGKLDGDFGPKTEQAVKDYQKIQCEEETGKVTPVCAWAMIQKASGSAWLDKFYFYEKF